MRVLTDLAAHILQLNSNVLDRLIAIFGILREATAHNPFQIDRCRRVEFLERRYRFIDELVKCFDYRVTFKRFAPGDCLKQNAAKRKNV